MSEFLVAAPVLAVLGLGTVQAGLAYHGKSILNYATFEAARTGAVHHALHDDMRAELAVRLAPLQGGDGSRAAAFAAIASSRLAVAADPFTTLEILNPSREAFEHFQVRSRESGRQVIPNSHLRHQPRDIDPVSGVNLQDANLLRIRVTYGFDLKVPLVAAIAAPIMAAIDPARAHFYAAGKLPMTAMATVRMQSEAYGDSLIAMASASAASPGSDADASNVLETVAPASPYGEPVPAADADPDPDPDTSEADVCGADAGPSTDPFLPTIDAQVCAADVHWADSDDAGDDTEPASEAAADGATPRDCA